ncbi:hypothetical protein LCGC14_0805940 [marine sediment metagenome]|uniref:Sulfurtransferase complex subunit TusB n=1 Tax=marine sediment metagenome TaxID=412755 RepID=A0A0F9PSN3_9ZZZZ
MNEKNTIVYLYGFSTRRDDLLESLIKILNEQIQQKVNTSIILIQDGVIGTSQKSKIPLALEKLIKLPITIYAIIPDMQARGIDSIDLRNNIKAIDYEDLVDILVASPKIVSWV